MSLPGFEDVQCSYVRCDNWEKLGFEDMGPLWTILVNFVWDYSCSKIQSLKWAHEQASCSVFQWLLMAQERSPVMFLLHFTKWRFSCEELWWVCVASGESKRIPWEGKGYFLVILSGGLLSKEQDVIWFWMFLTMKLVEFTDKLSRVLIIWVIFMIEFSLLKTFSRFPI